MFIGFCIGMFVIIGLIAAVIYLEYFDKPKFYIPFKDTLTKPMPEKEYKLTFKSGATVYFPDIPNFEEWKAEEPKIPLTRFADKAKEIPRGKFIVIKRKK